LRGSRTNPTATREPIPIPTVTSAKQEHPKELGAPSPRHQFNADKTNFGAGGFFEVQGKRMMDSGD